MVELRENRCSHKKLQKNLHLHMIKRHSTKTTDLAEISLFSKQPMLITIYFNFFHAYILELRENRCSHKKLQKKLHLHMIKRHSTKTTDLAEISLVSKQPMLITIYFYFFQAYMVELRENRCSHKKLQKNLHLHMIKRHSTKTTDLAEISLFSKQPMLITIYFYFFQAYMVELRENRCSHKKLQKNLQILHKF